MSFDGTADYGFGYNDSFSYGYGYADFSAASNEAYQLSWDAYNAGDMDASNAWGSISWSNWGTSTDLWANGADAYGTESPSTSTGYYPEWSGAYDSTYDTSTYDTSTYDTSTYDTSTYDTSTYDTSSYGYSSTDYSSTDYSSYSSYDTTATTSYDTSTYDTTSSYDYSSGSEY
jgi:hypothetical protein